MELSVVNLNFNKENLMDYNWTSRRNTGWNALFIVNMQNDFINGTLADLTKRNSTFVEDVTKFAKNFVGEIICTQTTHMNVSDYLDSREGHYFPTPHCIIFDDDFDESGEGYQMVKELYDELPDYTQFVDVPTGSFSPNRDQIEEILHENLDTIYIVGLPTDKQLISTALMLRDLYPYAKIIVPEYLCAGTTEEGHEAALRVMQSCQIEIMRRILKIFRILPIIMDVTFL